MKRILSVILVVILIVSTVSLNVVALTSADLSLSDNGVSFICSQEGFSSTCYSDSTQSSIGYGTKCTGSSVQPHASGLHSITRAEAMAVMKSQINSTYAPRVRKQTVGITMNQNQFDALVSLCYNCGGGTSLISNSPLVKYLKGQINETQARNDYSKYIITSGGKVLQGLIDRRNREANLFFSESNLGEELIPDSKYAPYLPLITYLNENATAYPYYKDCSTLMPSSAVWSTDKCIITNVYTNGWCEVSYPVGETRKTGYLPMTKFFCTSSSSLSSKTAGQKMDTFSRADMSSSIGNIDPGDVCYIVGTSGSSTQVIYPTPDGYKMGWTKWITPGPLPGPDERFNPYCPIKSQILGYEDIIVYERDFSTVMANSEIWTTDDCTITYVYNNGWCEVNYPAGNTTKTAYTPLSSFVQDTSATPERYVATSQVYTYTKTNMSTQYGWLSAGDEFFVVSKSGDLAQVLYPVDAQYGGGYKLGWIYSSQIPKVTYTVSYNANGGNGAPGSQTKTKDVSLTLSSSKPTRDGYTFTGWAESSDATTAKYSAGGTYTTNTSITLYAVWSPNKYEISYDLNGGYANISGQVKAHGTNINICEVIPEKIYTIYVLVYEDEMENITKSVQCKFLGWSTSSTATTASYQPGDTFTTNANVTLYAVWSDPVVGTLDTPTKYGYEFLGWYTQETGGTKITENTVITEDTTIYAHWQTNATPSEPVDPESPQFVISDINTKAGSTVTVDISVKNNPGITAFNFAIDYPTEVMTLTGVEYKTLFSTKATGSKTMTSPFIISWFSTASEDETANGVIATLTFKVNEDVEAGSYPINLTYDENNVFDSTFTNITFAVDNGDVTITDYVPGDVNGDTVVNMKDIVLLQQYLNDWDVTIDEAAANVNGDTSVNMKDIVLLQQYLNDWDVELK